MKNNKKIKLNLTKKEFSIIVNALHASANVDRKIATQLKSDEMKIVRQIRINDSAEKEELAEKLENEVFK